MELPQRRSGIPIPKSKFSLKKNISKSTDDLLSGTSFETSGELDTFTLLEENISLKEKIESVSSDKNSLLQKNVHLERENSRLNIQLKDAKTYQNQIKLQLKSFTDNAQKEKDNNKTKFNVQEQQNKTINELMQKIRQQEERHAELLSTAKQAKNKLEEFAPDIASNKNESPIKCDIVTADIVEQLINEIAKIRTQLSNTELQLYEANEKMAEITENFNNLRDENESLKIENSNLTKVAKLMTTSMKESVDTSKRMEEALLQMKKRYDDLLNETIDSADGPTVQLKITSANDEVQQLKDELKKREAVHAERIVEMNKLMESTIKTNTNDELNMLRVKLDVIEKELQFAIDRADNAESHLEQLKISRDSMKNKCFICNNRLSINNEKLIETEMVAMITKPPPPPPPMPNFSLFSTNNSLTNGVSLSEGIAAFTLNNAREGDSSCISNQQVKKQATGMDSLIAELRDGSVTLRRNRRKTVKTEALQEMFEILDLSRNQNRSSRIVVESHKNY